MIDPEVQKTRKPTYEINPLFVNRWSSRSFESYEIKDKELFALFEAARWAPSSFNNQPWRFIYAKRGSAHWDSLLELLDDYNKQWCSDASALMVVIAKKTFDHNNEPMPTNQFDTGSAWENLALQAVTQGLATHAMAGFDHKKARKNLGVPDEYDVMAMVVVGKRGSKERLPPSLKEREIPNGRKPLSEIVMEGKFGNKVNMK
ncbi:MAG: nitroreductase family protein [Nitrososphaera sp.]|jgi:nitroreductase